MISRKYMLTQEQINSILSDPNIRVVSFDIFDTLLVRPSMEPKDIFYLLQQPVKEKYGLDFVALRYHAEEKLKKENATLKEIWEYIAKKNNLDWNTASALMQEEIDLEAQLLQPREEIRELYDKVVAACKRIVITSDMYLPSEVLARVLKQKGYEKFDAVYVSCEANARKSDGNLYDFVLKKEHLSDPSQLAHIGDNYSSDYQIPLKKGITAIYVPSIWDSIFSGESWWNGLKNEGRLSQDPFTRLLYSFVFLQYENECVTALNCDRQRIPTLKMYVHTMVAPMLVAIAMDLVSTPEIQQGYHKIQFAARDGYLPQKIYDLFAHFAGALPSNYLYVSRRALSFAEYSGFMDYFDAEGSMDVSYSLGKFIQQTILDSKTRDYVYENLTEKEKELDLHSDFLDAKKALQRFKNELERYFCAQRELALRYYDSGIFKEGEKELVFDCGYSGSVARGLGKAFPKATFDKYYLWQSDKNRSSDKTYGTKTYCMSDKNVPYGFNIVCEECFSPLHGSCIGFREEDHQVIPVFESEDYPEAMVQDLTMVEEECVTFANKFLDIFSPYLKGVRLEDKDVFERIYSAAFMQTPYTNFTIFRNICFPDSYAREGNDSLCTKLTETYESFRVYKNRPTFDTSFADPWDYLSPAQVRHPAGSSFHGRIGIHVHMYYVHLYNELIFYLQDFPVPFDLIVTVPATAQQRVIQRVFTKECLPNLRTLRVLIVENRGRDVAPWLVATRPYQKDYDLFCHIHAKESYQYGPGQGDNWRRYLYDNLIAHDAACDILQMFSENENIGCVFPKMFDLIEKIHRDNDIPLVGEFGEIHMIQDLLARMHLSTEFNREDLMFSIGTMLWYRPKALQPLFDLDLSFEDFPEEPIPVGGTIAHAIERLPGAVAARQGYEVKFYNEKPLLNALQVDQGGSNAFLDRDGYGLKGAVGIYLRKKLRPRTAEKIINLFGLK